MITSFIWVAVFVLRFVLNWSRRGLLMFNIWFLFVCFMAIRWKGNCYGNQLQFTTRCWMVQSVFVCIKTNTRVEKATEKYADKIIPIKSCFSLCIYVYICMNSHKLLSICLIIIILNWNTWKLRNNFLFLPNSWYPGLRTGKTWWFWIENWT